MAGTHGGGACMWRCGALSGSCRYSAGRSFVAPARPRRADRVGRGVDRGAWAGGEGAAGNGPGFRSGGRALRGGCGRGGIAFEDDGLEGGVALVAVSFERVLRRGRRCSWRAGADGGGKRVRFRN